VAELHLDERIQSSRDVIGKHLATGQKKVSTAFNNLWNDIEAMREAQRTKAAEEKASAITSGSTKEGKTSGSSKCLSSELHLPLAMVDEYVVPRADLAQTQASIQAASQRAGAYLSSWGSWASEKRKTGWGRNSGPSSPVTPEKRPELPLVLPRSGETAEPKDEMAPKSQEPQPGFPVNGDKMPES
jgi:hypothetical protein